MAGYPLIDALGGRSAIAAEPATTGDWVSRIESGLPAASAFGDIWVPSAGGSNVYRIHIH